MLYTTLVISGKEYKLRLNAKSCVALEKRIGSNPLNIFMGVANNVLPSLEVLLICLHQSLTEYQHGITMDDVYDIYDKYCTEENGSMITLIQVLLDVFKNAGFLTKDEEEGESEKNF